jgi:hypothetical protein
MLSLMGGDAMVPPDGGSIGCTTTMVMVNGGQGQPGCGGGGGIGGNPGMGGGGSIALYATNGGTIIARYGSLIAAAKGGNGGAGGGGAPGAQGRQGDPGNDNGMQGESCSGNVCISGGYCMAEGGVGGMKGGQGGPGGQGGGGGGGASVSIVRENNVMLMLVDGGVVLSFQNGGAGGAPNGTNPGDQFKERTF